jgi:GTP-binding protein
MSSKKVPIVAIVGRANVGKSSLFNAFLGRREAIVADEAGTTRDSIMGKVAIHTRSGEQHFWVVDTAGMKNPEDDFEFTIQEQITQAADSADLIIVMIEAGTVITEEDRRVAKMALKSKKPVILVANKVDQVRRQNLDHLQKLGIKPIFAISVTQLRGVEDLVEHLGEVLPKASIREDDDRIRVALLGRPNVGKSALFNSLAKKQQAVVADRAGTTRDVNRTVVRYEGREIELLDTAGIRRSGKIERGVEKFSVIRSLAAIEQADVCLLLLDVNDLSVQLDQKIAGLIKEAGKGLALVVSKWDSLEDKDAFTRDSLAPKIAHEYDFVPWAPLIFTSSVTGQNVTKIFDLVLDIMKKRETRIKTTELNRWLRGVVDKHPPAGLKNRNPKLNYIVQEDDNPIPSFKVFGASTKFLHWSYKRYMEKELRRAYGFEGTSVQFWFIEKHVTHKHGASPTKNRAVASE